MRIYILVIAVIAHAIASGLPENVEENENPFKTSFDLIEKINSNPHSTWRVNIFSISYQIFFITMSCLLLR